MKPKIFIRRPNRYSLVIVAMIVTASFLLAGCNPATIPATPTALSVTPTTPSVTLTPTLVPTLAVVDLPQPEQACTKQVDWRGIKPGVSTKQDVINILGEPENRSYDMKHSETVGDNSFPFYAYKVGGGRMPEFVKHRVYFRADGVVDWIEVVVGDEDGSYHKVSEIAAELGNSLDAVYMNSNIGVYVEPGKTVDGHSGPDQLYVWSACGVVIDSLYMEPIDNILKIKYPDEPRGEVESSPNANSVILIKTLFIPTSYRGFKDYYIYKIPYYHPFPLGDWYNFLEKIRMDNK